MRRRPVCLFLFCYIIILLVLGAAGLPLLPEPYYRPENGAEYLRIRGRVRSFDEKDSYTEIIIGGTIAGKVRVVTTRGAALRVGAPMEAEGMLETVEGPSNPGQFDTALYYRTRGILCVMKNPDECRLLREDEAETLGVPQRNMAGKLSDLVSGVLLGLRSRVVRRIRNVYPENEAAVFSAMIAGDRSMLSEDAKSLFQTGGLMHMLAISGLHLSLLGMGLYRLLRRIGSGIAAGAAVSSAAMIAYTVLTGASVSSVRACVMFLLAVGADLAGRAYDPLTAMAVSGVLVLLENPYYLFYSGFQMSYAAVLICTVFGKRGKLTTAVMLYLGMMPLVLKNYYMIPLLGIPVNLIAIPALPVILLSGIAGTIFGGAAVCPGVFLLKGLECLLRAVKAVPLSDLVLGSPSAGKCLLYVAALALWAFQMKKLRLYKRRFALYAAVPFLILILSHGTGQGLRVTFLSVGQGDAAVIGMPDGRCVLIDAGSSSVSRAGKYRVEPFLMSEGITRIDYVFATHMDEDHVNGIREMIPDPSVRIGTLVMPYLANERKGREPGGDDDSPYRRLAALAENEGIRVLYAKEGDYFELGEVRIDVFGPDPALETFPEDDNAQCLVLSLRYRDFDALFTGDVQNGGEENVERILEERHTAYELLKVAHHGSRNSTGERFLDLAKPEVSVISCGKNNDYGHPHPELLERLRKSGTRVFRTDLDGAVAVRTDGTKYAVAVFLEKEF